METLNLIDYKKIHAVNFAKFTRDKEVTQLKSMDKIWEQWYKEFLEYENLSADDPCPICQSLKNEYGHCSCSESYN